MRCIICNVMGKLFSLDLTFVPKRLLSTDTKKKSGSTSQKKHRLCDKHQPVSTV